ncbi:MAG: glycosyltransferase family 1 protein [Paludibacteraceae bacterium]|nr:glycosyltransferase family 1 protein [Paludibacteraceae bacterium]
MKIGFDAKRAFYNSRGLGNYSRDTIRILSEQNADDHFYLFTPKIKDRISFSFNSNCELVSPQGFYINVPSVWRTMGVTTDINRLNLDIYHGLSNELPFGMEKSKARSVVTMHDLIFLKFPELYPWIDRQLYKKKYIQSCKKADVIVAISQQTKTDLIDLIGIKEEKIKIVYQGCNPIFLQEQTDELKASVKKKYNLPNQFLLTVGAIEPRKNHKLILDALVVGKLDISLIIVGHSTVYTNELKSYIHENKLDEKVKILSGVPLEDLSAIYQLATVFVYPSIFEGFGIPILEALNSRVPVVTSTGSCFEETGGHGSCYVDPYNPQELANALTGILNDEDKQKLMIVEGVGHAAAFSDKSISDNLMKIYKTLL